MSDFKVSFHEDDSFNLEHDNRVRVSKNVDADRIKDNISYDGNISIKEFYDMTFQKSYLIQKLTGSFTPEILHSTDELVMR